LNTLVVADDGNNRAFGSKTTNTYDNFSPFDANNTGYNWGQFTAVGGVETPDIPDAPDVPDTPDTPDVPDTPDTPEVPDTPVVPDTPDVPGDDRPDVPAEDEKCEHQFGRWFVLEAATEEKTGIRTHICELCGYEEREEYSLLDVEDSSSDFDSDVDSNEQSATDIVIDNSTSDMIANLMAGCQAVVGLPMIGMAALTIGGLLLKRKADNE